MQHQLPVLVALLRHRRDLRFERGQSLLDGCAVTHVDNHCRRAIDLSSIRARRGLLFRAHR